MAKVQNGEEILPKVSTPWAGRTNVTGDRRIFDSKDPNVRRNAVTFGKNGIVTDGVITTTDIGQTEADYFVPA